MKNTSFKTLQVVAFAVVTVLSCSVLAQQTSGGRRGGGFSSMMSAGGMTPDYMLRDLQRFQLALELEDQQTLIVEQILREYDESFREAADTSQNSIGDSFRSMRGNEDDPERQRSQELRTRSRDIREKLDSAQKLGGEQEMKELKEGLNTELESVRNEMQQQRTEQWQSPERQATFEQLSLLVQDQLRLKRQMREEFEGDLVAILTDEQRELWPPLQRQLIRDRLLPRGRLSGETTDVMGLVNQQEFEDDVLVLLLPVLQEWDESVTAALTARDEHMIENQSAMMSAMSTMDTTSGMDVIKTQGRLAESVRDINGNAIENIVLLLPDVKSKKFGVTARERGYPRIFRPTRTDRAFQAALELEGLEADILQAISELYESLNIETDYAKQRILEATLRWEAQEQIERMNRFAQRMSGATSERAESPIRGAEDDLRKIEENYLDQLRMLLTDEQIEALGGLKKREDRRGQGARGGDAGSDRGSRGDSGGREEFMNRFDKDGDGTISESEREAIREHFRNGGGHP